jgi:hypothetical protein
VGAFESISFGIFPEEKIFQGFPITVSIPEELAKKTSIPGSFAVPPERII